jgi:hypothetical protein
MSDMAEKILALVARRSRRPSAIGGQNAHFSTPRRPQFSSAGGGDSLFRPAAAFFTVVVDGPAR